MSNTKKLNLFDFVNDLTYNKKYVYNELTNKEYNPFMINRALSQQTDLILYANEMNLAHQLSKEMQYDFYFYGIESKKRYGKWAKASNNTDEEAIKAVIKLYDYSRKKAIDTLNVLTDKQIEELKERSSLGGLV